MPLNIVMVNPEDKFVNKFSPITPEEERRQKEKELSKQRYESYKKASAPIKILTEDWEFYHHNDNRH